MLTDRHRELLRASAISAEVVEARSYYSAVATKAELGRLGFGVNQRRIPALVIPQWNVLGECTHHMLRPDEPRQVNGKPVKYETPAKATQVVDVPPGALGMLDDPAIPLIVTEGSRKADAAVSRGMCAVSLNGVYGWRGTNAKGGKAALPDWEQIALNGRAVLLAFDNDALTKAAVHEALRRLRGFLAMRKALVRVVVFPPDPSGRKVGLDDWLAVDATRGFAELEVLAVDELPDLDPGEQVDTFDDVDDEHGWLVLDELRDVLTRFVWFPSDGLADAVALWVAHTHLIDVLDYTPRLHARSPMKRSGKSRLLEVIHLFVPRPMLTTLVTPAVLFRAIEALRPTLLLDEVDRQISRDAQNADDAIISVLNSGFRRGMPVYRNVGQGTEMALKEFQVFAAVAMSGIGLVDDTLTDRSITIRLERRPPGELVADFRQRDARAATRDLARRLAAWCARRADAIGAARPVPPNGLNDRAQDIWEPLLAIADAAGAAWPTRARDVAVTLAGLHDAEDVDSTLELQLLADIHETWPPMDRRFSAEIVAALNMLDGRPWADSNSGKGMTTNWLARKLKAFGVHPTKVRIGPESKQGYYEEALLSAWERYGVIDASTPCPDALPTTGTSGTSGTDQVTATRGVPDVPDVPVVEGQYGVCVDTSSNGHGPATVRHTFRKPQRS